MKKKQHSEALGIIENKFAFLVKNFGFDLAGKYDEWYECQVVFKNQTVGVVITFNIREFYFLVQICRLINHEIYPLAGEIRPDTVINNFDLNDLLSIRSPSSMPPPHPLSGKYDTPSLETLVAKQAENLRQHAQDVLRGDFSVFPLLDEIVKRRAKEGAFQKWGDRAKEYGW